MRPPAKVCGQLPLGLAMADEDARLARMREAFEAVGLGQLLGVLDGGRAGHQTAPASEPALDLSPDRARQWRPARSGAIDQHAALRLDLGDRRIASPQPLVKGEVALLDRRRLA